MHIIHFLSFFSELLKLNVSYINYAKTLSVCIQQRIQKTLNATKAFLRLSTLKILKDKIVYILNSASLTGGTNKMQVFLSVKITRFYA